MIKLGTVFSGIGAIEHALQRMELDHQIVFACDNGDVEILTKDVGMNIDAIGQELEDLEKTIKGIQFDDGVEDLYKNQLSSMLDEAVAEFHNIVKVLEKMPVFDDLVQQVLIKIISMDSLKASRKKEYSKFLVELGTGSTIQSIFREFQVILKIFNDFRKDNDLDFTRT